MALAYYAEPRSTIDIDINIFCSVDEYEAVATALGKVGVETMTDVVALARDGQCRLSWGRTPIDLFFAYAELHSEMAQELRRVPFAEVSIPILAPHHLAVCKAIFDRPKDWIDIEQMLLAADGFDRDSVKRWLVAILGDQHLTVARFGKLADQNLGD